MKRTTVHLCALLSLLATGAYSAVTITAATNTFSGDYALNGPFPSYQAIQDIVIAEQAKDDIGLQTNSTLVLTLPGWRFRPGSGSVSVGNGSDLSGAQLDVTDNYLTLSFSARKTQKLDRIVISGLEVRAHNGDDVLGQKMVRSQGNQGSAVIKGVQVNATVFALARQTAPVWRSLAPLSLVGVTNEHPVLRFGVLSSGPAYLEASHDFVNWTTIRTNVVNTNTIVVFEDVAESAAGNCFYRLRQN